LYRFDAIEYRRLWTLAGMTMKLTGEAALQADCAGNSYVLLSPGRPVLRSLAVVAAVGFLSVTGPLAGNSAPLAEPSGEVLLRVTGEVANANVGDEAHFDRAMIDALPARRLDTSTVVTDGVQTFDGVLMRDLLEAAGARGEAVTARALNDYVIEIPMSDFGDYDVVLALRMGGEELTARDKGPLWIVYPRDDHTALQDIRYDYRWVWQLVHVEVR
jgi:hypothetical protein